MHLTPLVDPFQHDANRETIQTTLTDTIDTCWKSETNEPSPWLVVMSTPRTYSATPSVVVTAPFYACTVSFASPPASCTCLRKTFSYSPWCAVVVAQVECRELQSKELCFFTAIVASDGDVVFTMHKGTHPIRRNGSGICSYGLQWPRFQAPGDLRQGRSGADFTLPMLHPIRRQYSPNASAAGGVQGGRGASFKGPSMAKFVSQMVKISRSTGSLCGTLGGALCRPTGFDHRRPIGHRRAVSKETTNNTRENKIPAGHSLAISGPCQDTSRWTTFRSRVLAWCSLPRARARARSLARPRRPRLHGGSAPSSSWRPSPRLRSLLAPVLQPTDVQPTVIGAALFPLASIRTFCSIFQRSRRHRLPRTSPPPLLSLRGRVLCAPCRVTPPHRLDRV